MEVKLNYLKCTNCGHTWLPRQKVVYICPKCKVYTWNKERPLGKHGKRNISKQPDA